MTWRRALALQVKKLNQRVHQADQISTRKLNDLDMHRNSQLDVAPE